MTLGILSAITATMFYKFGVILQKSQAEKVNIGGIRILKPLAGRPLWLLGISIQMLGFGFHYFALTQAPVTVVQPIIAAGIVFVVIFAALLLKEKPTARELLGMTLAISGVSLLVSQTGDGHSALQEISTLGLLQAVATVAGAIGIVLWLLKSNLPRLTQFHPVLIGAASGFGQGMSDAMNRLMGAWLSPQSGWVPTPTMGLAAMVLLALFGFIGFIVAQNAFRSYRANTVVPCIITTQLLVPVVIAVTLYGQALPIGTLAKTIWIAAFALTVTGILTLATSDRVASRLSGDKIA